MRLIFLMFFGEYALTSGHLINIQSALPTFNQDKLQNNQNQDKQAK